MATDDFNRANETPLSGGGAWATISGLSGSINLAGNQIKTATTGLDSGARYTLSTVASSRFRIATVGDSDGGAALWAVGESSGYIVTAFTGTEVMLYRIDAGSFAPQLAQASATYGVNKQLRIRRSGGNVIVSLDSVDIITHADSTYLSVNPGWFGFGTVEADDFTDDDTPPVTVSAYADITGTRRNRPGRGPYSLGQYFRPSADAFTGMAQTYGVSIAETTAATDAISAALSAVGALSETATGLDGFSALLTAVGAIDEAGAATDSASGSLVAVGALSEATSATDTLTSLLTAVAIVSETASASDTISSIAALIASLSESGSAADLLDGSTSGSSYNVSIVETASAADALSAALSAAASIAETGNAADTHTAVLAAVGALSESGAASDAVVAQLMGVCSLAEIATALDSMSTDARIPPRGNRIVVVSAATRRVTIRPN